MIIEYQVKVSRIPNEETIKVCDDGAKAFQDLVIESGKVLGGSWFILWLITRFYKRTITDKSIKYDFYLIK